MSFRYQLHLEIQLLMSHTARERIQGSSSHVHKKGWMSITEKWRKYELGQEERKKIEAKDRIRLEN